jgi:putative endonuclease
VSAPAGPSRQRRSGETGRRGERIAALWLMLKGYRILARRYGGKGGEIDLIARRGAVVIFVEVKARADLEAAAIAVTASKARLMQRRIALWVAQNPWASGLTLRADAVFLGRGRWPRHEPNIFPIPSL